MKFLIFVSAVCTLVYGISAETCESTNDGSSCLSAAELSLSAPWTTTYSGGETCFEIWGGDVKNIKLLFFNALRYLAIFTNLVTSFIILFYLLGNMLGL